MQNTIFQFKTTQPSHYLQQLVGQVGLNQPVVQRDVEELVLGPLGQTEDLLELEADNWASVSAGRQQQAPPTTRHPLPLT